MPFTGKRILIVEDEFIIALELEREVVALGGEAIKAASFDAALDAIATTELNGALLDVKLGGQRTFLVADALAARGVPFVFETGTEHSEAPARHAKVPWLGKPFKPGSASRALLDVMRQAEVKGC